jgi:large subunit ribosomal protein L23
MITEELHKITEADWVDILRYPLATEKASNPTLKNYYTFVVDKRANKTIIKKAFESVFKVKIIQIQTLTMPKKTKRRRQYEGQLAVNKKAIIRLSPEYTLDFFGMEKTSLGI